MSILLDYLFGNVQYFIPRKEKEKAINILHKNQIYMKKIYASDEDTFTLTVSKAHSSKVAYLLDKSDIKVYSIKRRGLPFVVEKYKKRYGFFVGILIFCFLLWYSQYVVWEIDYSGNKSVSDSEVERQLLDVGFGVGSYIPSVDFYTLCNNFLVSSDDFSFISVNMEGTKAHVELRERQKRDEKTEYEASNIVAKYSGVIDSMTVYSGQTVVEKEAVVKEGELLVSGFLEKTNGFDIVRSKGSVYAYVTRSFEVEIPFEKEVKIYTDNTQGKTELTFFGKTFCLKNDIDDSIDVYDANIDRERLVLFDRIRLPMICTKTFHHEYRNEVITIDKQAAKNEAEQQLSRIMLEELSDAEILERSIKEEINEKSYKLVCNIYCLADIAEEKEIILNK